MMIHRGCGGEVVECDDEELAYEYEGSMHPALFCKRCHEEILGDAELEGR